MIKITLLICLTLSGCATHQVSLEDAVFKLNQPHRIIEHSFEREYNQVISNQEIKVTKYQ